MLKDLFTNRLFVGALAFFVLIVVSGTLYLRDIEQQGQIELERTEERLKQSEARQKQTEKVPEGDTSQGGHWHGDEWHAKPHAPVEQPSTADGNPPQLHVETPSAIAQENPTSDTLQDPSAESSRTRTPQEVAEIQREWREWHDKWKKLSDEHIQTTQEWVDALPQTPEELERFKTDENYKREVQRQLQAAMDKDGKAYVRLQEHEKTRPAIPPTQ